MAVDAQAQYVKMTQTPVPKLIGRLAAPTMVSMMITSIYNMADTFFVGKLGTSATGAVGVVFSLMAIIQAVGFTFGMGAGSCISRLLGQRKEEEASRMLSTAFFSAAAAGLLLTAAGLTFLDPLMRLLGATETILPFARDYARYILLGAPYMCATFVMNNCLRSEGQAFLSMMGIAGGGLLNCLLDPLFIFGFDMGISGAAIATILSQLVSFFILLSHFLTGRASTRLRPRYFTFRWHVYKEILRIGAPTFFRQGLSSISSVLLNTIAGGFGDAAIAAMSIVTKVSMFVYSALLGFGQGFQPVSGYNWGARRYDRLWEAYWFCVKVALAGLSILGAVGFLLAPQVIAAFSKESEEVVRIGAYALRVQCLLFPLQSGIILSNMLFQSIGKAKEAAVLALSRQGLCFFPMILILPRLFEIRGIQWAQPGADLLTFLISLVLTGRFLGLLFQMRREVLQARAAEKAEDEETRLENC
ncbi:MAG: MATE family efflux transporter [Oscillospiraceae bacterium]|nr:MATE family efflux transporter [Oscillospiraceae bacterium]